MLALVMRLAPVSTDFSTFSPLEAASAVLMPLAHAVWVLNDEGVHRPVLEKTNQLVVAVEADQLYRVGLLVLCDRLTGAWAIMRLDAKTPRRFGLAVIRSVMILRPVVA